MCCRNPLLCSRYYVLFEACCVFDGKSLLSMCECVVDMVYVSNVHGSGFGGLEVACWPLVPKFTGSNPAEAVGFFRAKKSSARLPSEGK